ncbi:MAG: hypothetical protein ACYCVB_06745 [Bacilli bacterium]
MTYALLAGGVLFAFGLWWKALGMAVIGAGIFTVCWIDLLDESVGSRLGVRLRLLAQLPRVRTRTRREMGVIDGILPLCRQYAERYPVYVRLPFVLGESGEIYIALSDAERKTPFSYSTVPGPVHDLAAIVSRRTHTAINSLTLLLILNREVRRLHAETLSQAVWQGRDDGAQADFSAACLRFAVWERERARYEGACTLLYRDLFAQTVFDRFTVRQLRSSCRALRATGAASMVDRAVADAWTRSMQAKRAVRLEAVLQKQRGNAGRSAVPAPFWPESGATHSTATAEQLAALDPSAAARRLQAVFATGEPAAEQHASAHDRGYFVAASEGKRVLFQVGFLAAGSVPASAVAQAYTHAGLESADQAIILALGPVQDDVLKEADELGVLMLPWEHLDRLLAVHADRMWHAVEWSLRASRRAEAAPPGPPQHDAARDKENQTGVLELGLST